MKAGSSLMQRQTWTALLAGILRDEAEEAGSSETAGQTERQGQDMVNLTADTAAGAAAASQPQEDLPVYGPHLRLGDRLRMDRERRRMEAQQQTASGAFEA